MVLHGLLSCWPMLQRQKWFNSYGPSWSTETKVFQFLWSFMVCSHTDLCYRDKSVSVPMALHVLLSCWPMLQRQKCFISYGPSCSALTLTYVTETKVFHFFGPSWSALMLTSVSRLLPPVLLWRVLCHCRHVALSLTEGLWGRVWWIIPNLCSFFSLFFFKWKSVHRWITGVTSWQSVLWLRCSVSLALQPN